MTHSQDDYSKCIELACKMNSDTATRQAFESAMAGSSENFASWLAENGVPSDWAKEVANLDGDALYTLVGQVVCKNFW